MAIVLRPSAPDHDQRDVREQTKVAGADRPPARHDRRHVAVEKRNEEVEHRRRHTRSAQRHRIGARQHRRAHDGARQRLADADRATDDELRLERGDFLRRETMLEIAAKSGIEAIDGPLARRGAFDDRARRRHPRARLCRQRHVPTALRDAHEQIDVEPAARQNRVVVHCTNISGNSVALEGHRVTRFRRVAASAAAGLRKGAGRVTIRYAHSACLCVPPDRVPASRRLP